MHIISKVNNLKKGFNNLYSKLNLYTKVNFLKYQFYDLLFKDKLKKAQHFTT